MLAIWTIVAKAAVIVELIQITNMPAINAWKSLMNRKHSIIKMNLKLISMDLRHKSLFYYFESTYLFEQLRIIR